MVVVRKMQCPLLCKDFIIDIWQIYYAWSKGADAILLIAAVLPDLDIKYMLRVCRILGMTALVEVPHEPLSIMNCHPCAACTGSFAQALNTKLYFQVHDERELDRVLKIDGVQIIGINNRSLGTCNNIFSVTSYIGV